MQYLHPSVQPHLKRLSAFKLGQIKISLLGKIIIVAFMLVQTSTQVRNVPVHTSLPQITAGGCYPDEVMIFDNDTSISGWFNPTRDVQNGLFMSCVKCTEFSEFGESCRINSLRLKVITVTQTAQFNGKSPRQCRSDNGYQIISTRTQCAPIALNGDCFYKTDYQVVCFNSKNFMDSCYQCWPLSYHPNYCFSCGYNYYRTAINGAFECQPLQNQPTEINKYCMYSWNPDICKTCMNGYYLLNNLCNRCPNMCEQCYKIASNPPICTRCLLGYVPDNSGQFCTPTSTPFPACTIPHCLKCFNITVNSQPITQCLLCDEGYYPLRQLTGCTSDCSQIMHNCVQCYISKVDLKTKCRKCKDTFHVNFDGQCKQCTESILNCHICTTSKICIKCQMFHYLNSQGTCSSCLDAGNNCIACKFANHNLPGGVTQSILTCSKCEKGQHLVQLDTSTASVAFSSQCASCFNNCILCNDAITCTLCKKTYFLSADQRSCQTCPIAITNCLKCHPTSITASCLVCATNSALQSDPDNRSRNICGGCSAIDPNCIECQRGNVCTKCSITSGTYIDFDTNKCKPCLYPCKNCLKKYKCIQCAQSWMVITNTSRGQCINCRTMYPSCVGCKAYQDSNSQLYKIECTQCKAGHFQQPNNFNPFMNQTCEPCADIYTFSDLNTSTTCFPCQNQCQQCTGINECFTCLNVYAHKWVNSKLQCYDKCGDKKLVTLDCDLDIGNMHDGCTGQCQVEPGFVCELYFSKNHTIVPDKNDKVALKAYLHTLPQRNSTQHFYSRCSYNGKVQMSVKRIIKERFSNRLTVEVKLEPFLHSYKLLSPSELHSIFKLTYNNSILQSSLYTTELLPQNHSVLFTLQLQHHLTQPLSIDLSHSTITSEPRNFTLTQDSSLTFVPDDQTGVRAFFYSSDELSLWKSVHIIMQVLSAVGVVGALVSVAVKNLAGIEFLWILQAMYVSLFWYQEPLTPPLFSLSGLSLSAGINPRAAFSKPYLPQTVNSRLLYESSVHYNSTSHFIELQLTVFLFPILYFLSQLAWVLEDVSNAKVVIWARYFNAFFSNDGLMLAALFMLQSLLNQAFALYFTWNVLEPFSQYLATMLIAFGGVCMVIVLIGWFRTQQPKYAKTNQKNRQYGLLLSPFSRYNMPVIKQKFYSVYIMIMILSTLASVFGSFYPLMPVLLYVFLAFIIVVYRPYTQQISNYRALFFTLVIAFGYFIRVVYIFSFAQDTSTPEGYTLTNVWVIYVWMVLAIGAFIFFIFDVVKAFRLGKEMEEKMKAEFEQKINGENKILHKKMGEEAKKYDSHKNQLQNLTYNNFYHHEIGPKIDINDCKDEEDVEKKFEEAKKKTKPKPVEKDEVFYISNKNKKRPQDKSKEDDDNEDASDKKEGNKKKLNQWLQEAKDQVEKERVQKVKKEEHKQLSIAYEVTMQILQQREKLIEEKFKQLKYENIDNFDLISKLVHQQKIERIQKVYKQGLDSNIKDQNSEQQIDLESVINQIKQQKVEEFKAVKACDKDKKDRYGLSNFPQVEIHYKKAEKMTEEEKQQRNKQKKRRQNLAEQRQLNDSNQNVRLSAMKKKLRGKDAQNDNQKKQSKTKDR